MRAQLHLPLGLSWALQGNQGTQGELICLGLSDRRLLKVFHVFLRQELFATRTLFRDE